MPSLTIKQGVKNAHDLTLNEKAVFQILVDDYLTGKDSDLGISKIAKSAGLTADEVARGLSRLESLGYIANVADDRIDWAGAGTMTVDSLCVQVSVSQAAMSFAAADPADRRNNGYDLVALTVDDAIQEVYAEVVGLRLSVYDVASEGDDRPSLAFSCRDGVTRNLVTRMEDVTHEDWNTPEEAWGYFDGWCENQVAIEEGDPADQPS